MRVFGLMGKRVNLVWKIAAQNFGCVFGYDFVAPLRLRLILGRAEAVVRKYSSK